MREPSPLAAAALLLLVPALAAGAEPQRLSLGDAVSIAASSSPAVALAELREREARARVGQARAAFLPGLSASAYESERTFNLLTTGFALPNLPLPTIIGPYKVYDARLRATQTLFDGASWARIGAARTGVRVSQAERRGSAEGAAQTAALAYLQAARAEAQLEARRADEAIAAELAQLAEQQENAGVSPGIDVVRARTQLAAARGARLVAENQLDRAQIALARALGVDPSTRFVADTLSADLARSAAADSGASSLAQALERRPELEAERSRLQRARADRRATSLERLPRLEVSGDWGPSGIRAEDAVPTRQWTVALSVPLLDGLRRESRIAEQSALVNESEVRERDLRAQVAAEVQGALLDIQNGGQQQSVALERLALAERELAEARERFANGVASNVEVINAQGSLVRARDTIIDARYATAVARVTLARAAGAATTLR